MLFSWNVLQNALSNNKNHLFLSGAGCSKTARSNERRTFQADSWTALYTAVINIRKATS